MVVRAKGIRCIYPGKEQLSKAFYDELIKSPVPEELDKCIDGYFASLRTPAEQAAQNKRKIKCILTLAALIIAVIFLASSIHKEQNVSAISDNKAEELHERSDENPHESTDEPETTTSDSNDAADVSQMTYYADIEIQDYGTITVQLDQIAAPITTANFISLAQSGFYDGLTFHHIIEDFMMQGGDPEADGTGGAEESIIGEFSENGYDNPLSHTRGAISMARSSDYDSASSQFFIVHEDSTFLDGQYAVFGYVTQGMDVVDAVCEGAEPTDDNGSIAADAQPVILSVTIRAIQNES
ncbi:MAG: peptidylprolyl isomerase [Oscillospiraceae bacterium]|nr:peptidylprolyl isomerase [Oscillospiraceae bacterium]